LSGIENFVKYVKLIIKIEITKKAPIAISPEAIALCAKKTKIAVIPARAIILRISANVPRKTLLILLFGFLNTQLQKIN